MISSSSSNPVIIKINTIKEPITKTRLKVLASFIATPISEKKITIKNQFKNAPLYKRDLSIGSNENGLRLIIDLVPNASLKGK